MPPAHPYTSPFPPTKKKVTKTNACSARALSVTWLRHCRCLYLHPVHCSRVAPPHLLHWLTEVTNKHHRTHHKNLQRWSHAFSGLCGWWLTYYYTFCTWWWKHRTLLQGRGVALVGCEESFPDFRQQSTLVTSVIFNYVQCTVREDTCGTVYK